MRDLVKYLMYFLGAIFHHNRKSKILYYHDIGTEYTEMGTSLSMFISHINEIRKTGFSIVDIINKPDDQVMIAFDDGWKGLYDNRQYFIENKLHPTVFIAVGLIGQNGYMNQEEIAELKSIGFRFQAHSWSHTGLPDHHGMDLIHELVDSKKELESMFGGIFDEICFPQGRFSDKVIEECRKAGYIHMFTSLPGSYYDDEKDGLICRNLLQSTPKSHIKYILTGDSPLLKKRYYKQHFVK